MVIEFYRLDDIDKAIFTTEAISVIYVAEVMNIPYIKIKFDTPTPVDLALGDYIIYENNRYNIYAYPDYTTNQEQYQYEVILQHENYNLYNKILTKVNTTETIFKLVGRLEDVIQTWLWNVNHSKPKGQQWVVNSMPNTPYREIQFTDINCFEVLKKICEIFYCEVDITLDKQITFSRKITNEAHIDLTTVNDKYKVLTLKKYNDFYTRAYIRGGNKNIPIQYQDETGNLKPSYDYLEDLSSYPHLKESKKYFENEYPFYILPIKRTISNDNTLYLIEVEERFQQKVQSTTRIKFLSGALQEQEYKFTYDLETNLVKIHFEQNKEAQVSNILEGDLITFTNYETPTIVVEKSLSRLYELATDWFNQQKFQLIQAEIQFNVPYYNYFDRLDIGSKVDFTYMGEEYPNLRLTKTQNNLTKGLVILTISNHPGLYTTKETVVESTTDIQYINLSDLEDVDIKDLQEGDSLVSDGDKWVNKNMDLHIITILQQAITDYFNDHQHEIGDIMGLIEILEQLKNQDGNNTEIKDLLDSMFILRNIDNITYIEAKHNLYSVGGISALGLGDSTEPGTGGDFDRLDKWEDYNSTKAGWVLSALLGQDLNMRTNTNSTSITDLNQRVDSIEEVDSDKNYIHTQGVPSDTWTINHTLNKYPSVTIIDSGGTEVIGNIKYINSSTVSITFSSEFSGKAILN